MTFNQFLKNNGLESPVKEQHIELLYSKFNNAGREKFGNELKLLFEAKLGGIGFPANCNCPAQVTMAIKRLESIQPKKKVKEDEKD